jgi:hypothetical protein
VEELERLSGAESIGDSSSDGGTMVMIDADPVIEFDMSPSVDMSPSIDMSPPADLDVSPDMPLYVDADIMIPVDMSIEIDMEVPPEPVQCGISITVAGPEFGSFHHQYTLLMISGSVDRQGTPIVDATIMMFDRLGNEVASVQSAADGSFIIDTSAIQNLSGLKEPYIQATVNDQPCLETFNLSFYMCSQQIYEDFTVLPPAWTLFRDASWNAGGWLEMTGIDMGKAGAAYNNSESIVSGRASIEFTLTTGGGINDGADGFAFTIVELNDPNSFINLINAANTGGGLGYGVGGSAAEPDYMLDGEALTVEIDTYHNRTSEGNRHDEPTSENHIAITRNGDPGDHIAWFAVPNIEDLLPHIVRVDFQSDSMQVFFDGDLIINQEISFMFKGGYMFFSGSTGWATNFHRFDNLKILHGCQ